MGEEKNVEEAGVNSSLFAKTGMMYFEYNPEKHMAARPHGDNENEIPRVLENFPESYISKLKMDLAQAEIFRDAFSKMDRGSLHESFDVQLDIQGVLCRLRYNLISVADGSTKKVVCVVSDISELYLEQSMEKILLGKRFDGINVIEADGKSYHIRFFKENPQDNGKVFLDYDKGSRKAAEVYINSKEKELFISRTSLETIKHNLEVSDNYTFTMTGIDRKGCEHVYQYSYYYLDEDKRQILATLVDVTKIMVHDALTGEFNRNGFIRYVTDILKKSDNWEQYAILFFNIKSFKAINELVGLDGGERILCNYIRVLRDSYLKPIATSRFEADHFVLFVERSNLDFKELTNLCHQSIQHNGKKLSFYGRCGIYCLENNRHDVSGMCDRAKLAKKYITDDYVKPYAVYSQAMRESFIRKKELLSEFEQGVHNNEFEVYYQPVYDAETEKIVSAEALVRWIHPEYGMISPAEFIPTFEENGYISQLDLLVESRVKAFILDRIRKQRLIVPIAINMSRMDFYDSFLMGKILEDMKEISCLSQYCRLEITESAYLAIMDNAERYISRYREAGVKIMLDDFGSGYSSFSTIKDFDFDMLKLDMGFVRKIGESRKVESIVLNIINMAHDLGLKIIAEGVETEIQKNFLHVHRCDFIQGFYYSKPLPESEFIALLENN
ncbi:MAG: GGDEF domain-containing phosphodiesterase [Eubacteriales bacterium]|nr:GGDEF domain-containing phosphodiesterase [Eubacteriales bacterium]